MHLLQERQVRFGFIQDHYQQYPVELMCKCMEVSRNSYYTWKKTGGVKKQKASVIHLKARIKAIYYENRSVYGSDRIQKALEKEGFVYSRAYVGILMKEMGLKSIVSAKFKVCTTDSDHSYPIAENKLNRDFSSLNLGEKWVSDITYVLVNKKWCYITTIIDLADRKVLSWVLSEDMRTENTVKKAWLKARKVREITENHIFHSDRGVQYASNLMYSLLRKNTKITQSMSRKGNCWDNSVAESFFKTLKYECLYHHDFKSVFQLFKITQDYINWYNNKRMHSSLGYKTPLEKEVEIRIRNNKNVA